MQQRYYDPLIGQHFLSVDPVTAYSPGGAFNQYWYANANPYRMVDPDGRDPRRSSANEVYLASGGDWGSGQTVSAGIRRRYDSKSANATGAPSEQIDQWMTSKDAKDRLKAAFAAISFFKIKTHGEILKVTTKYPGDSGAHGEKLVTLYGGSFSSWSWLGTTLGHEFEGHNDSLGYSPQEIAESEVRAYRYSLDNVKRFGNSPAEVDKLEASYQSWLEDYESWRKYQGEW